MRGLSASRRERDLEDSWNERLDRCHDDLETARRERDADDATRAAGAAASSAAEAVSKASADAAPLAAAPLGAVSEAAAAVEPDDLKKIEGIGPKIASLLNDAGIHTFAALAETRPDAIREILMAAGERFRIHDPSTWPDQARLAADGKWDELEKLQDILDGGRT